MSEQNKALVRNYIDTIWNKKDLSILDQVIDPNLAPQGPMTDQLPPGPEGQKIFVSTMINAFPDVQCTIENLEANGDWVRATLTYRGTHTGPLMDIPPTGKRATVNVVIANRIVGGKVVEGTAEWDPQDMLRQLGVAPT